MLHRERARAPHAPCICAPARVACSARWGARASLSLLTHRAVGGVLCHSAPHARWCVYGAAADAACSAGGVARRIPHATCAARGGHARAHRSDLLVDEVDGGQRDPLDGRACALEQHRERRVAAPLRRSPYAPLEEIEAAQRRADVARLEDGREGEQPVQQARMHVCHDGRAGGVSLGSWRSSACARLEFARALTPVVLALAVIVAAPQEACGEEVDDARRLQVLKAAQ
eukprot:6189365-Prymnesium_polylepis.1